MTNNEYNQKLNQCKTIEERNQLNDEFLNSKCKINKINKRNDFFMTNILVLIDIFIGFASLIIAIIALFK